MHKRILLWNSISPMSCAWSSLSIPFSQNNVSLPPPIGHLLSPAIVLCLCSIVIASTSPLPRSPEQIAQMVPIEVDIPLIVFLSISTSFVYVVFIDGPRINNTRLLEQGILTYQYHLTLRGMLCFNKLLAILRWNITLLFISLSFKIRRDVFVIYIFQLSIKLSTSYKCPRSSYLVTPVEINMGVLCSSPLLHGFTEQHWGSACF